MSPNAKGDAIRVLQMRATEIAGIFVFEEICD